MHIWFVTSCQELQNPASSGHCCFSSGEEFLSAKNKETEVGEAIQSSSKQNKNVKLCSFVIGQQSSISQSFAYNILFLSHLHWALPKGEIILILWQKSIGIHCFGLNTFVDVV